MFGSLVNAFAGNMDGAKSKLILYIIAGVIVLVIVSVLLDGIRKFIRGLDIAALGALFIWLGYQADKHALANTFSDLLYLVGGTLAVTGLLLFIVIKLIRGKRKARKQYKAKHQEAVKAQMDKEENNEEA